MNVCRENFKDLNCLKLLNKIIFLIALSLELLSHAMISLLNSLTNILNSTHLVLNDLVTLSFYLLGNLGLKVLLMMRLVVIMMQTFIIIVD